MTREFKRLLDAGKEYSEEWWNDRAITRVVADLSHRSGAVWAMKEVKKMIERAKVNGSDVSVNEVLDFVCSSIDDND